MSHSALSIASRPRLMALGAVDAAQHGGEVVHRVVSTMDQIQAGSRRIAEITGTLDGIAFQTNILALNAAAQEQDEWTHF